MGRRKLPRTDPQEQICKDCGVLKQRYEFTNDWRRPAGINKVCKACVKVKSADSARRCAKSWNEKMKRQRIEEPEKHAKMLRGRRQYKYHADFDAMWAAQDGKCAICGAQMLDVGNGPNAANMDHDRACCPTDKWACGKCVRGLIHKRCNLLLGHCHDDAGILDKAAAYLRSWQIRERIPVKTKRMKRPFGSMAPQIRAQNNFLFRQAAHEWFSVPLLDRRLDQFVAEDAGTLR